MADNILTGRFQQAVYTAAALAAANPVLLDKEVVYESDSGRMKLGDGTTPWNNLPYFGDVQVGGVNLALNSAAGWHTTTQYKILQGELSQDWVVGQTYSITIKGTVNAGNWFGLWRDDGSVIAGVLIPVTTGLYRLVFTCPPPLNSEKPTNTFSIYNCASATASEATIEWIKIERGNKPTDWSPAPEDIARQLAAAKTYAEKLVADVQVGGVNLALNTTNDRRWTQWGDGQVCRYLLSDNTPSGEPLTIRFTTTQVGTTPADFGIGFGSQTAWNNKYFLVKVPKEGETFEYTIAKQSGDKALWIYFNSDTTLHHLSVQTGNKPTDWSPAPEDVQAEISYGKIYLRGTGFNRDAVPIILVNGVSILPSYGRGMMLAVLNRLTMQTVKVETYDIFGSVDAQNALAAQMAQCDDRNIVILVSYDAIGITTPELKAQITRCGGTQVHFVNIRMPYALLGIPDIGEGNGLETYTTDDPYAPHAQISVQVINGIPQGIASPAARTAAAAKVYAEKLVDEVQIGGANLIRKPYRFSSNDLFPFLSNVTVKSHTTYTFSGTDGLLVHMIEFAGGRKEYFIGQSSGTFTTQDGETSIKMCFDKSNIAAIPDAQLKIKLERGNKPTDWSPAPEDVADSITTAQAAADNAETIALLAFDEASTKLGDAPQDGKKYLRRDGAWNELTDSGGSSDLVYSSSSETSVTISGGMYLNASATTPITCNIDWNSWGAGAQFAVLVTRGDVAVSFPKGLIVNVSFRKMEGINDLTGTSSQQKVYCFMGLIRKTEMFTISHVTVNGALYD